MFTDEWQRLGAVLDQQHAEPMDAVRAAMTGSKEQPSGGTVQPIAQQVSPGDGPLRDVLR